MKLSKNFVLRQVAGESYIFPLGENAPEGVFALNESGVLLWQGLQAGDGQAQLVERLTAEYAVSPEQAAADVAAFLEKLAAFGCLEQE